MTSKIWLNRRRITFINGPSVDVGLDVSREVNVSMVSHKTKLLNIPNAGGAMGSADEVNITISELNRTMRVRYLPLISLKNRS